mgnify:CR=1 FL=1
MAAPVQAPAGAPPVNPPLTLWEKVGKITVLALKVIAAVSLFIFNPIVFTVALLLGIVLKERVDEAVQRIKEAVSRHFKAAVVIIPCMMLLAIPATPLIFSFAMGCYVGAKL